MIIGEVNRAAHTHQNVKFLVFGDETKLGPLLEEFPSISHGVKYVIRQMLYQTMISRRQP